MPAAPRIPVPNSIRLEGSGVGFTATSLSSSEPSAPPVLEENSRISEDDEAVKVSVTRMNGLEPPTGSTNVGPNNVTPPRRTVSVGSALQQLRAFSTKLKV